MQGVANHRLALSLIQRQPPPAPLPQHKATAPSHSIMRGGGCFYIKVDFSDLEPLNLTEEIEGQA